MKICSALLELLHMDKLAAGATVHCEWGEKQEVKGRTSRILYFDKTRIEQKTTSPTIIIQCRGENIYQAVA
jgi:hypothetical protein